MPGDRGGCGVFFIGAQIIVVKYSLAISSEIVKRINEVRQNKFQSIKGVL